MPTDFDWIFERDPYSQERSKAEAPAKSNGKGEEVAIHEVIEAHPQPTGLNRDALLRCIDACFDCAATCTSCADACLAEQDVQEMVRCIRLNLDCADASDAAGRILTRQTVPDVSVLRTAIQACAEACRACGDECDRHAEHHEHCRVCAGACRRCEQACNDLLATIG